MEYRIDDRVTLKKAHACGANEWAITRLGADVKLRCCACQRLVMLSRREFESKVRRILSSGREVEVT